MIKNRELALIPDSALEMLEVPATSPSPAPRPSARPAGTPRASGRRPVRRPEPVAR